MSELHEVDWCDRCGAVRRYAELHAVETLKATHSSPAEGEWWCDDCLPTEEQMAYEDEMRSLRGYTDEERERI